jgi:hypothetical protein
VTNIAELRVYWPTTDSTVVLTDLAPDQRITVTEGQ